MLASKDSTAIVQVSWRGALSLALFVASCPTHAFIPPSSFTQAVANQVGLLVVTAATNLDAIALLEADACAQTKRFVGVVAALGTRPGMRRLDDDITKKKKCCM